MVGVVCILSGIYTMLHPENALNSVAVIYGILAVIIGIADIVFYVQLERHTGFGPTIELVSGVLNIMLGFFLILNPNVTLMMASIFLPIWFIAHSIGRLCNLNFVKLFGSRIRYGLALAVNLIQLVLGVLMLLHPFASLYSLAYLAGFYLIAVGAEKVIALFVR